MARPCKNAVLLTSCSQTKEEMAARQEYEEKIKGGADNIRPPNYLNARQREIFCGVVAELHESGILGNLDVYILTQCAVSVERLESIETMINNDPELLMNGRLKGMKEAYSKDFYRCCNELCLTPQSRAKLANINLQNRQEKEDPLLAALRGDGD